MNQLYAILYTSIIADDVEPTCIADITRVSRINNRELEITGLLAFDGWRFCQYIEGASENVVNLMQKIEQDPRHTEVTILYHGLVEGQRLFDTWSLAYAETEDEEMLLLIGSQRGQAAVNALTGLLPRFDLEP